MGLVYSTKSTTSLKRQRPALSSTEAINPTAPSQKSKAKKHDITKKCRCLHLLLAKIASPLQSEMFRHCITIWSYLCKITYIKIFTHIYIQNAHRHMWVYVNFKMVKKWCWGFCSFFFFFKTEETSVGLNSDGNDTLERPSAKSWQSKAWVMGPRVDWKEAGDQPQVEMNGPVSLDLTVRKDGVWTEQCFNWMAGSWGRATWSEK